jgi:alanine-synthesizing transaminase
VRFSRRTAWDRTPNEMALLLEAGRREGILDLTETNPTRAGLAADPARLAEALSDPGNVIYEPEPLGLCSAREALSTWLLTRGVTAPPERLVLTASTSEAYNYLFKLCCDPGDAVLVPTPSYPLFDFLARLADVEAVTYRLRLTPERWTLDVDALAASLHERARVVLVVSPNNPTGSVLTPSEARDLAALCASRGLTLVSDEVFGDFWWGEPRPSPVLEACEREGALGVVLSGLSKACGLPQLKLGWMILGGPPALVDEARARLELVADTYLSVSTPVQRGLPRLLEMGDDFRARLLPRLRANIAALRAEHGDCVLPGEAGWSAIIALPEGVAEQEHVSALLRDRGVLVHPGWLFDLPMPSIVVSLLVGVETIAAAVTRTRRSEST